MLNLLQMTAPFYIPTSNLEEFQLLYTLTNPSYFIFYFNTNPSSGMKWYLIVVLIWVSLKQTILGIFSCVFWPFLSFFWRNADISPLPIFYIEMFVFLLKWRSSLCTLIVHSSYGIYDLQLFFPFFFQVILWLFL